MVSTINWLPNSLYRPPSLCGTATSADSPEIQLESMEEHPNGKPPAASNYRVYTDETTFRAALGEVLIQGFEASLQFACPQYGTSYENAGQTFESASFSVTNFGEGGTSFACVGDTNDGGNGPTVYATEGTHFLAVGNSGGYKWTLNFTMLDAQPVYAVGFYMVDSAQTGDAVFIGPDGTRITMVECCQPDFSIRFFGVVSKKPVTSFSLDPIGSQDGWAIDEFMLGFGERHGVCAASAE